LHDRPDPAELAEAVREFLEREIVPALEDHRVRFRALVAMNALGIIERELRSGETALRGEVERLASLLGEAGPEPERADDLRARALELNERLARSIRDGRVPAGAGEHLRETAREKLLVASPRYLERYG